MLDEQKKAKLEAQTREIYEAIGRFCVEYENMVHALQLGTEIMLQLKGLSEQKLVKAVTADLTAEPLRRMWHSTMLACVSTTDFDTKVLSNISSRANKLIALRNDTLHRLWFVGYANESMEDFSTAYTIKHKNSARGVEDRSRDQTAEELRASTQLVIEVTVLIHRVNGSAVLGSPLVKNFAMEGGRAVVLSGGQPAGAKDLA